jgi:arabinofuranosyltransferase
VAATLPALFLLVMGYRRRWVSEDAFIDLRVVGHLLAGHGPVFNVAERVEAYSSPLWVALLAACGALRMRLETAAVALGLALSAAGILAAQAGAWHLARRLEAREVDSKRLAIPLGMIVFVAIPVAWDFSTSGLETGLVVAWLGMAFWLLTRARASAPFVSATAAFVTGLGVLVRPDLAIFSLAFFVALAVQTTGATTRGVGRRWLALAVVALGLPAAYQVFRAGYFAALVPNTALAKEASAAYWPQGWRYAIDFARTYWLCVPLLLGLGWWTALVRRARGDRAATMLLTAPALAAGAHAVYIVRVGGDFMHGRFLLPALFGWLLPLATATVPLSGRPSRRLLAATGLVAWAVACALWLRVPYRGTIDASGIADERGFWIHYAGTANPVRVSDYEGTPLATIGRAMRSRDRVLVVNGGSVGDLPLGAEVPPSTRAVIATENVGILGYTAGPSVHITDRHGLADPIASRLRLSGRQRPGHEKMLPEPWIAARFAALPAATSAVPATTAASAALGCGLFRALLRAVEEPLTLGRFFENLRLSWALHRLRIPPDPAAAQSQFCGSTR